VFAIVATARTGDVDRIRVVLTGAGYAWTRPRSTVLHVLVSAPTPLRVDQIHGQLSQWPGGRGVNLSSVYRTVNLLQRLHLARRVQLGDGPVRYELAEDFRAHHHHFVCEACGRIEDVRRCPLEGADLGAGVRAHHLELFGVCRDCDPEPERAGHVRL
jgi:Fur family ferric uptake transcriptional regulator